MIKRFDYRHIPLLQDWLITRGIKLTDDLIPGFGLVSYVDGTPAAMGFLRITVDGDCAIFDGLTSNPHLPGEVRNQALDEVIGALVRYADTQGITTVMAWTLDESTLERSKRHGFEPRPDLALLARRRQA